MAEIGRLVSNLRYCGSSSWLDEISGGTEALSCCSGAVAGRYLCVDASIFAEVAEVCQSAQMLCSQETRAMLVVWRARTSARACYSSFETEGTARFLWQMLLPEMRQTIGLKG